MATMHLPHPIRNHPAAARNALDTFWVLAVGVIAAYAFFAALGAFSPTEVGGVSVGVAVLVGLCLLRIGLERRHNKGHVDTRVAHARERRGF